MKGTERLEGNRKQDGDRAEDHVTSVRRKGKGSKASLCWNHPVPLGWDRLKAGLLLMLSTGSQRHLTQVLFSSLLSEGKLAEPRVTVGSSRHIKGLSYPSYSSLTFRAPG